MARTDQVREVAALFVRKDSVYKALAGVDPWDRMRNARYWPGGMPLIAHPPCSQWGALSHMANRDPEEKSLGLIALGFVREFGGVLEHPRGSKLWWGTGMPLPDCAPDAFGGWTLAVDQWWWGHVVNKPTWFYIVGCKREEIPPIPYRSGKSDRVITNGHGLREGDPGFRSRVTQREREFTPPALAAWLVELARSTKR